MEQIRFKNNCGCIVDEELLSRAIHGAFPYCENRLQKRSIYLTVLKRGAYPVVSITVGSIEREHYISRLIAQQMWPGKVKKGIVVHHVDSDPLNNAVENLQLMTRGDHSRLHHRGYTRHPYDEEREEAVFLYQEGYTLKQIGKKYNCSRNVIRERLKKWNIPRRPLYGKCKK